MSKTGLSEEQRLMRQSCRDFVDKVVTPFIRQNWQREWLMEPGERLPKSILEGAEAVGIRTLGVPEEFGGIELDRDSEVRTFAIIAEEIARGDSGLVEDGNKQRRQERHEDARARGRKAKKKTNAEKNQRNDARPRDRSYRSSWAWQRR